jgi:hypothetical protein
MPVTNVSLVDLTVRLATPVKNKDKLMVPFLLRFGTMDWKRGTRMGLGCAIVAQDARRLGNDFFIRMRAACS